MESLKNLTKHDFNNQDIVPLFLHFCGELAAIIKENGMSMEPVNEIGMNRFRALTAKEQIQIASAVRSCVQQIRSAQVSKIPLVGDNRKHAWWSLRNLGFVPPSDLFEKIHPQDMIEIYDKNSLQLFRSFELYEHLSYTLSEIFSHTWMELFERDDFVFNRLMQVADRILLQEIKEVVETNLPSHVVKEKFSCERRWIRMQHRLMSPLYDSNGNISGFLSAFWIADSGRDAVIAE